MNRKFSFILILLAGCSDPGSQIIISNNAEKIEQFEGKIDFLESNLKNIIEYYDQESTNEQYENYRTALSYISNTKVNPKKFNKDSLESLIKLPYDLYDFKHHYQLIEKLLNSPPNDLANSEIQLEFVRLEAAITESILSDLESLSFQMNEPHLIIQIEDEIYKKGETVSGEIFFTMGSDNMKSSVNRILVNGDPIDIDESGKGVINLIVDSAEPIINAEIELKYPVNGKYNFQTSKKLIVK